MKLVIKYVFLLQVSMLNFVAINAQKKSRKSKIDNESDNNQGLNKTKPNIIFILADDLGIGNISAYGADHFNTPNIDLLAKEGIRFNHAYTAPLCGPSRAMILTGRYAFRTGGVNQDNVGKIKPSAETLIPQILKTQGYVSTCAGKWSQFPLHPSDFGFDDYIHFKGSGVYWLNDQKGKEVYYDNGVEKKLQPGEYMPNLVQQHLIEFIGKNKNKPFFAYYPMTHVHGKIQPTPDSKPESKDLYTDNINYMDKLVGNLVKAIDSMGIRQNTLIVFMGDNGTANGPNVQSTIQGKKLSGKKGSMLECGSLVPFIANWTGTIMPNQTTNQLIDATDLLPTFASLAGAAIPKKLMIDGKSFAKNLTSSNAPQREWIFIELGKDWYVREANWKLNRAGELFDMTNAPFEEKLVAEANQNAEAKEARARLSKTLSQLDPASGIMDEGDGSGRHANKQEKKEAKKEGKKKKEDNEE